MNARKKLNVAHINGALLIAAADGFATGSWVAFGAAAVVAVGKAL